MLLITIFVELRLIAGSSRKRADSPQAVSTGLLCRGLEKGMDRAWHGRGLLCVNRPLNWTI